MSLNKNNEKFWQFFKYPRDNQILGRILESNSNILNFILVDYILIFKLLKSIIIIFFLNWK
jgi:hypothetical protein